VKGDIKKPRKFEIPLLDAVRPYAGYNPKYPAKSEFYRRTSVWDDVTEILRGKTHEAQKPKKLHEIPILAHTSEGETVLDPFAGSLMTGLAATSTGRGFVLVEKDLSSIERHLSTLPPDTQLIRA
jgi:DNA modification methylase